MPTFGTMEVVACADLILERAKEQAQKFGVPRSCSPEELLEAPDVDLVVNLTVPAVHAELAIGCERRRQAPGQAARTARR